jgi:uncharacterized membrane protein YdjX (TVP38/TMEM64 family)
MKPPNPLDAARRIVRQHPTALRLGALILLLVGLWLVAWRSGLLETLDVQTIRAGVQQYGWAGILVYLVACTAFNLLQVPGMVLIFAAIVAWGPWLGGFLGWLGAVTSASTTFVLVRAIGGQALGRIRHPWARRMLDGLERRPILTMVVLRALMQAAAPLNATLALTNLGYPRYLLGSAIGLIPPVIVAAWITELFL